MRDKRVVAEGGDKTPISGERNNTNIREDSKPNGHCREQPEGP